MTNFSINSKKLFLAHFRPIFAKFGAIFFFSENSALPRTSPYGPCHHAKFQKNLTSIPRRLPEGLKDGPPATAGGPITNSLSNRSLPKPLLICESYVDIFSLTILAYVLKFQQIQFRVFTWTEGTPVQIFHFILNSIKFLLKRF